MPSVVVIGVIASLCFSVGEGLRLTPFPLSALTSAEPATVLVEAIASDQASLHKYGPLDVRTQNQKRNKRHTVDFACPPTVGAREIPHYLSLSVAHDPFDIVSVRFASRPAGRAPPSVS